MLRRRYKIYLVDDNEMYIEALKKHLENSLKCKYRIETFKSGNACLEAINSSGRRPDVVVLDYFLDKEEDGDLTGIEVLQKINAITPKTDVIMLSAQDRIETAIEIMKHSAYDYVVKSESAFHRITHLINNLIKSYAVKESLKMQKRFTAVVALIMFFIVAGTLTAYFTVPDIFYIK